MAAGDFQASTASQSEVERLYLAARVEAALVTDSRTQAFEISASVPNKEICLTGPYLEEAELAVVKEVALEVSGVEEVQYSPGYASKLETNHLG